MSSAPPCRYYATGAGHANGPKSDGQLDLIATRWGPDLLTVRLRLNNGSLGEPLVEDLGAYPSPSGLLVLKCQYGCDGYGSSLCCPPNTPTPKEMRQVLDGYGRAVLFEAGRREPKKIAVRPEREAFLSGYYKAFGLGAGPCSLCKERCGFGEGCRHAEQARPSMEACGIDVFATVRANGFTIEVVRDRSEEPHYFGLVLLD